MTDVFDTYLKAEQTKISYRYVWQIFCKYSKFTEKKLFSLNRKQQEQLVIDYATHLKDEKRAPTTISLRLNVLQFVFSMNDIMLNWKKLKKMTPEKIKPSGMETWKDQEIRDMIKVSGTIRNRAIIYGFVSMGCRNNAMINIKLKDIEYFEDCMCVMIYADYPEEYPSFVTPEGTKMIKYYLKEREERGEKLTPESYLWSNRLGRKMTVESMRMVLSRIFSKFPNSRKKQGFRYNIQVTHGFRKWQATKLKLKIDVHHSISERLLGHKAGLDSNYFVTSSKEAKMQLFEAFKKCIPDLTLDKSQYIEDSQKQQEQIKELTEKYEKALLSLKIIQDGLKNNNKIGFVDDFM